MTEFSDIKLTIGPCKILMNIDYADYEFINFLEHLEEALQKSPQTIIKDQMKTKIVRVPIEVNGQNVDCHIKRYKLFSLRKKLEALFAPSRASKAWNGAKRLLKAGINTAEPIAAVEVRRRGLLKSSYFISRTIPDAEVSVHYFQKNIQDGGKDTRIRFVRSLASSIRRLHQANVYHNDLKDYNILAAADENREGWRFWFLDVDCVSSFRGMTTTRIVKNLAQLNRTIGKEVTEADKVIFLNEFFDLKQEEKFSPKHKKIIQKVLSKS